jgi:beta-glucanase (GH16 family)
MRWYPDRVEWYVNGFLVKTHTSPVPDQLQPARASLWAGGTTWGDAFDASLAPVSNPAVSRRFTWDVDYIMVTRLSGGDPGGSNPPAAPTNLSASVNGGSVNLAGPRSNGEAATGFTVPGNRRAKPTRTSS